MLGLGAATCWPALAAPEDVLSRLPLYTSDADVFSPYIGYGYTYDDNVLGNRSSFFPAGQSLGPSGAPSGAPSGDQSDTTRRVKAGLNVRKRISRQIFTTRLDFYRDSYDKLTELNHDGSDLAANWEWHAGNQFEGNIGASYLRELTPFVNFQRRQLNLRTQRRNFIEGGWLIHPSWRLRAAASYDTLEYDLTSQNIGDRNEAMAELGIDYLARSGSKVGLQLRHTRGDLPNAQRIGNLLVDNSYGQNEIKARIDWLLTGKTQLLFLGGYVQRTHDVFPERDYSGLNARLIGNWIASGKTNLSGGIWREIGPLDDLSASFTLNQGANINLSWDMTSKIRLAAEFKRETSDYSGTAAVASRQTEGRIDTYNTASLKLTYRPTRKLQLIAQVYRSNRSSNVDGNSYPNTGMMLSTRYDV